MRFSLLGLILVGGTHAGLVALAEQPNVVILLADDLGYADVGFHGSDIQTPHIDRIAREGVRLERFYACPMCSPTRAGLMTGRWPLRFGLMRAVIPPWCDYGLPTSEHTLAELMAEAGYARRGIFGKWHLGHAHRGHHPLRRGFTHFVGHYNGAIDYFTHEREGQVDWHHDDETVYETGYSTELIGRAAAKFIDDSPAGQPYFVYVPFNAPHSPFQAQAAELAKYTDRQGNRRVLAAMIDSLDQSVGMILDAIQRRGDGDNTFVLFFSDNGGVRRVADNRPLRGGKLTPYEGGIRVVAAARFPRGGISGGMICQQRMGYIDVYPTLKKLIGHEQPDLQPLDGIDVLSAMAGQAELPDRDWFTFEAQQNDETERVALTTDRWKLVVSGAGVLSQVGERNVELFDMTRDWRESTNVAAQHPRVVKELLQRLRDFRKLQTAGVPTYSTGREGFVAPRDWILPPAP